MALAKRGRTGAIGSEFCTARPRPTKDMTTAARKTSRPQLPQASRWASERQSAEQHQLEDPAEQPDHQPAHTANGVAEGLHPLGAEVGTAGGFRAAEQTTGGSKHRYRP